MRDRVTLADVLAEIRAVNTRLDALNQRIDQRIDQIMDSLGGIRLELATHRHEDY